jgi:hypothetical protein
MVVIERLLRYAAVACSAILLLGFGAFAYDQAKSGSDRHVEALEGIYRPDPPPETERQREARHSDVREAVDDANDVLLKPFAGIVHADDVWVDRIVPTVLALLVFGFGLGFLARYTQARS